MIKNLHEDAYFRVEHAPDMDVYRVARTARPFADNGAVAVEAALTKVPAGAKVLLDVREDAKFDLVLKFPLERFARVAVLVNKPAEVQRVPSSGTVRGFDNEDKAFDHLLD
jgi:hypothetical protein